MDNIIDIANYLFRAYKEMSGEELDEMKLHKLLYFIQRESFAVFGEPLFKERLEGWVYGPVSPEVRSAYSKGEITGQETRPVSRKTHILVKRALSKYGDLASWKLSQLAHEEISWQNARKGLDSNARGDVELSNADIQKDAVRNEKAVDVPLDVLKQTSREIMDLHQAAYRNLAK